MMSPMPQLTQQCTDMPVFPATTVRTCRQPALSWQPSAMGPSSYPQGPEAEAIVAACQRGKARCPRGMRARCRVARLRYAQPTAATGLRSCIQGFVPRLLRQGDRNPLSHPYVEPS